MNQSILYTDANGAEQFFSEDTIVPALKWVSTHQPGGLFVYKATGIQQIIYASDAVIRIFGCRNAAEFIGLTGGTFPGIVHPDDRKETLDSIDAQIAQAKNQNLDRVEYRIIRRDGTVSWLEDYGHFTRLPEFGDVFYVYITDVSEKHRQESERLRYQNIYARLIAVHSDMRADDLSKCRVNLTSGIIEDFKGSNLYETDFRGGLFSEAIDKRIENLVTQGDREKFRETFEPHHLLDNFFNGREHMTFTGYLNLSSGKPSFVRFEGTIVVAPNSGNVILFGSERKYNTEKVTEILNHKVLAKQYDMVTYLVGDSYRVVIGDAANVKKGSIFPDKTYGNYTRYLEQQVLPAADPETHDIQKLRTALSPETIKRQLSARDDYTVDLACRIDGEIYNKRFTFYLADPEAEFYLLLKSDVTDVLKEEREKNQMLAVALKEAESANAAKTAFLSSMSHEIRTPMNAIIGLGNIALQNPALETETRDYLEKIGASARHLLGIINDILDMSRIESGKATLKMEEFSFSDLLKQINTLVQTQCDDKGLNFQCRILGSLRKRYIGDDTKLRQVIINILSNAIKFTDAPGTVKFTVEQTAEFENTATMRFIIEDTGIGMDKAFIPKIFEAFSQENSGRTTKYGSTGLGMAITASLVDMMNGTIEVDSEKGKGTRFTVTVSLRNVVEKLTDQNAVGSGDMKVLIVDEDPFACAQAKLALDDAGISADCLYNHDEILRTLEIKHGKSEPYNLLLMDWKLPGANCVALTKLIKARFKDETAVLVMSSFSWEDIRNDAEQAGIDGFLSKPLAAADAADRFRQILCGRRSARNDKERKAVLDGRRILLAEDIAINAEIMKKLLGMKGMTVDHAENGNVAVELFKNSGPNAYSAVLMDVRMPVMDGLAAAAAIRKLQRDDAASVPIIAMTANAFDEDVQLSLQAGMNAHLSKPVNPTLLYETLETQIGASQLKYD